MNALNALGEAIALSGTNHHALAVKLGRSKNYVSNFFVKGFPPRIGTYAEILGACGYELVARCPKTGHEITIDSD